MKVEIRSGAGGAQIKPTGVGSIVPALRKLREERGTHMIGCRQEPKAGAPGSSYSRAVGK